MKFTFTIFALAVCLTVPAQSPDSLRSQAYGGNSWDRCFVAKQHGRYMTSLQMWLIFHARALTADRILR